MCVCCAWLCCTLWIRLAALFIGFLGEFGGDTRITCMCCVSCLQWPFFYLELPLFYYSKEVLIPWRMNLCAWPLFTPLWLTLPPFLVISLHWPAVLIHSGYELVQVHPFGLWDGFKSICGWISAMVLAQGVIPPHQLILSWLCRLAP